MLLFILLFISVLFMGVALFSIVLHFSRKQESAFQEDDSELFVLQKDEKKELMHKIEDIQKTKKHDILEEVKESSKTTENPTKKGFGIKGLQDATSTAKDFSLQQIEALKKLFSSSVSVMNSLFTKLTQAVKDQVESIRNSRDIADDVHDNIVDEDTFSAPTDNDFKSLYSDNDRVENSVVEDVSTKPKPKTQKAVEKKSEPVIDEALPKRVSSKDMAFFALDTEDDMVEEEEQSAQVEDMTPKAEEKEPHKKAESFVKDLMEDQTFSQPGKDQEDAISDNYYYTYMEKRYIKKIVANPRDVEVYRKLGDLYVEMESFEDAVSSFEQVLRLKPGDKHASLALKEISDKV